MQLHLSINRSPSCRPIWPTCLSHPPYPAERIFDHWTNVQSYFEHQLYPGVDLSEAASWYVLPTVSLLNCTKACLALRGRWSSDKPQTRMTVSLGCKLQGTALFLH